MDMDTEGKTAAIGGHFLPGNFCRDRAGALYVAGRWAVDRGWRCYGCLHLAAAYGGDGSVLCTALF